MFKFIKSTPIAQAFIAAYEQYKFVNSPEVKAAYDRQTQRGFARTATNAALRKAGVIISK